jgi:hypothetical protein
MMAGDDPSVRIRPLEASFMAVSTQSKKAWVKAIPEQGLKYPEHAESVPRRERRSKA